MKVWVAPTGLITKNILSPAFAPRRYARWGGDRYEAHGALSIKGISKQITLPFTLTQKESQAHMRGEVTVKRTDFNIGAGEWATDPAIGYDVKVIVDLQLKQALTVAQ